MRQGMVVVPVDRQRRKKNIVGVCMILPPEKAATLVVITGCYRLHL